MPINVLLEGAEAGHTVTVQNWTEGHADDRKFWGRTLAQWLAVENVDCQAPVDTVEAADSFTTVLDYAIGEALTVRLIYRDSTGQAVATEMVDLDASGTPIPTNQPVLDAVAAQAAAWTADGVAGVQTALGVQPDGSLLDRPTTGVFGALTEAAPGGYTRFTGDALEKAGVSPRNLDLIQVAFPDQTVQLMYQITRTFVAPDPALNITLVRVYRAVDPYAEIWPVLVEQAYTQGDASIQFTSEFTGYFRLGFVDADGLVGEMSDTFSVADVFDDIDLKFKLEKDSKTMIVGDQKYLTVIATDRDGVASTLPQARVSVEAPDGSLLVDDAPALVDGMAIKYLLDTSLLASGIYKVRAKVATSFEVLQSPWFNFTLLAA